MNEEERELGTVIETVTVNHQQVVCMKWRSTDGQRIEIGTTLIASPATHGEGPGPNGLEGTPEELVEGLAENHFLLSVTGDRHTYKEGQAINECTVLDILPRVAIPPAQPITIQWPRKGEDATMFTDGTFSKEGTLLEQAQGRETTTTAAAVVVTDREGDVAWRIEGGVEMKSAYDA